MIGPKHLINRRIIILLDLPKPWNLGGRHPHKSLYWIIFKSRHQYPGYCQKNFTLNQFAKGLFSYIIEKKYGDIGT